MKISLLLLLLTTATAQAMNPSRPSAPRSPVRGAIEGKWIYSTGGWPDAVKVVMTIGRSETTFVTEILNGGQPCVASITVATSYDDRTFSVLAPAYAQGRSWFAGNTCDVRADVQNGSYELNGKELTLIGIGGLSTTYQRSK